MHSKSKADDGQSPNKELANSSTAKDLERDTTRYCEYIKKNIIENNFFEKHIIK